MLGNGSPHRVCLRRLLRSTLLVKCTGKVCVVVRPVRGADRVQQVINVSHQYHWSSGSACSGAGFMEAIT